MPRLPKRCPPGLSPDDRTDFLERQAEFDRLLKEDKDQPFNDIEAGGDTNGHNASTFPGGADYQQEFDRPENAPSPVKHLVKDGKRCKEVIPVKVKRRGKKRKPHRSLEAFGDAVHENQTEFGAEPGQQLDLRASADYQFWRLVGHAVHDLPAKYKHRAFLVELAESGNLVEAAGKHHLTRKAGRHAFRQLLVAAGLGKSSYARSL
jgi:hypothetical protein